MSENALELIAEIPEQKKAMKKADMLAPVNEVAFASFIAVQRRRVEAWRRERGQKGVHWEVFGGDCSLTRKGAIQCALDLGHGISVQNTVSWPYRQREGERMIMRGLYRNNRVVKAVRLTDGLTVVVKVKDCMDYPINGEFMAFMGADRVYTASGPFDRRGW